ncbi:hypothetical protein ACW5EG_02105 [Luteimonas sp. A611]
MRAILATPQFPPVRPESVADRAPSPRLTLEGLVSSCVRDASGDPVAAALLLEDRIRGHTSMLAALVQPYLADACWKAVKKRLELARGLTDEPAVQTIPDTSARLHALADSLLDFRLPSGTLLRDAFRHDVEAAANWYLSRARALQRRGKWLEAIAPLVPRAKVVGHILDDRDLRALLDRATAD